MAGLVYRQPDWDGLEGLLHQIGNYRVDPRIVNLIRCSELDGIVATRAVSALQESVGKVFSHQIRLVGPDNVVSSLSSEVAQTSETLAKRINRFCTSKIPNKSDVVAFGLENIEYYVDPEGLVQEIIDAFDEMHERQIRDLWRKGFRVERVSVKSGVVWVYIVELDKNTLKARDLLLLLDKLVKESVRPASVSHDEYKASLSQLDKHIAALESLAGSAEVWVPPDCSIDNIKGERRLRHQILSKADELIEQLFQANRAFDSAGSGFRPTEYRNAVVQYGHLYERLETLGVDHKWVVEIHKDCPTVDDLNAKYESESPAVLEGAFDRNLPGWETSFSVSGTPVSFDDVSNLFLEYLLQDRFTSPDSYARLANLNLLAIHQFISVQPKPPDLKRLLVMLELCREMTTRLEPGYILEGAFAAVRQVALHLSVRPDVGIVEGTSDLSSSVPDLVLLVDGVTSVLLKDFQRYHANRQIRGRARVVAELSVPLMSWLTGVARPWFMVPGSSAETRAAYSIFLSRLETITGLAWVGLPASTMERRVV